MKYRLIGVATAVAALLVACAASALAADNPSRRVHQHLEARQPGQECACDGSALCTHLPLVLIDTGGKAIPGDPIRDENQQEIGFTTTEDGEEMLNARIAVVDNAEANNHPGDAAALDTAALIRIRGNSSRYFDKKSYLLRFVDGQGAYADQAVMGMDAHYEWALYGPYLDKSLLRNYMWYNIAGEIMDYAPNVRFCEVMVDGEYRGLYVMLETITSGKNCRLNLTEPIKGSDKTGFLLRLDRGSTTELKNIETFTHYTYRNLQALDIKYPRTGKLTAELADAIAQEFSDFEKALYSYDYDTDDYGYWHYIDADSFVDYFLLNEFTANYDAGWLSTYVYKDVGGKYKMVIWDFNSACDNYTHSLMEPQRLELHLNVWYYMLLKDEYFCNKLLRRYEELRKSYLSDDYLNRYIDDTLAYLGDAVDRNFEVWGYTFDVDMLYPAERNPANHSEAVASLKSFIFERAAWMDDHLEILKQYSHESKVKKFNH